MTNKELSTKNIMRTRFTTKLSATEIQEYQSILLTRIPRLPPPKKSFKNKHSSDMELPLTYDKYLMLNELNLTQLKSIAKHYKIKPVSGNKKQIYKRVFYYYYFSRYASIIQRIFRGFLAKRYVALHGQKGECVNTCDFYTLEPLKEIPWINMFWFDQEEHKYGCHIASLYRLIKASVKHHNKELDIVNPYNRKPISTEIQQQLKKLIQYSQLLLPTNSLGLEEEIMDICAEKVFNFRIINFVNMLNEFGYYLEPSWFHNLNNYQWLNFFYEFKLLWMYRLGISQEVKRQICPPHGISFNFLRNVNSYTSLENIQTIGFDFLEKIVYRCPDYEYKIWLSMLILMVFTKISNQFEYAFPWLYDAMYDEADIVV